MAQKIIVKQRQTLTVTATTAAGLDTAIAAQVNTLSNNLIGLTDSSGALVGNQNIYPDTIAICCASAYLDTAPALHFVSQVQWTAAILLT